MTTFNKNWALRANRGVAVLAAPLRLVVTGCKKMLKTFRIFIWWIEKKNIPLQSDSRLKIIELINNITHQLNPE